MDTTCFHLWKMIHPPPPPIKIMDGNGVVTDNTVYKVWWKNDQHVISFINSCISKSVLFSIGKRNSAKELWEALESSLSSKGISKVSDLQCQIHIATKGNMTTNEYINMLKRLSEELSIVGYLVDYMSMMFAFLRGLGHDYIHFNISMNSNLENLNFKKLVTNLKTHEACLSFYNQVSSSNSFPPMANQVQLYQEHKGVTNNQPPTQNRGGYQNYNSNRGGRQNRGRGRGWNNNRSAPKCQICGLWGHRGRECREHLNVHSFLAFQCLANPSAPHAYMTYKNQQQPICQSQLLLNLLSTPL